MSYESCVVVDNELVHNGFYRDFIIWDRVCKMRFERSIRIAKEKVYRVFSKDEFLSLQSGRAFADTKLHNLREMLDCSCSFRCVLRIGVHGGSFTYEREQRGTLLCRHL